MCQVATGSEGIVKYVVYFKGPVYLSNSLGTTVVVRRTECPRSCPHDTEVNLHQEEGWLKALSDVYRLTWNTIF